MFDKEGNIRQNKWFLNRGNLIKNKKKVYEEYFLVITNKILLHKLLF